MELLFWQSLVHRPLYATTRALSRTNCLYQGFPLIQFVIEGATEMEVRGNIQAVFRIANLKPSMHRAFFKHNT